MDYPLLAGMKTVNVMLCLLLRLGINIYVDDDNTFRFLQAQYPLPVRDL